MHTSHPASLNELAVLMELRLAFGPGTRLWANSSREDMCYEWLYFKGRQSVGSLRDFARSLIAREGTDLADRKSLCDIRKRVAAVLRAYHIKRPRKPLPAPARPPVASTGRAGPLIGSPHGGVLPGNLEPRAAAH
jgi:hypothetical protein